jgi:DNA (cytosine-5)-methyltransferase 1
MPEKNRFPAVLQPTAYRWQNDALGLQQDDAVAALRASAGSSGFHEMNHPVIAQPVPIQDGREIEKRQNGLGIGQPGDPAYTVDTTAAQAVAFTVDMQACKGNANVGDGSVSPTLCKPSGNDVHAVAIGTDCYNGAITGDVAATMGTPGSSVNASGPTVMQAMAFDWQSGGDSRGLDPKETAQLQRCQTPAVAHSLRADGFDASEDGTGRGTPLVPQAMTVRRLSPRECERLQGFPDNWTLIPWRKKPAEECPDGPRYKALGNSMACNCMAWIGEKIAKWEADHA